MDGRALALLFVGALLLVAVGTPLYTAGYTDSVADDANLRNATCVVTRDDDVRPDTCTRSCNCRSVPYTGTCYSSTTKQYYACTKYHTVCDTCTYPCWTGYYYVTYAVAESSITYASEAETRDARADVEAYLARWPVGKQWPCFYNVMVPSDVRDSLYAAQEYYVAAVVFLVLGAVLVIAGAALAVITMSTPLPPCATATLTPPVWWGTTPLPSLEVPSANSTMWSPPASRLKISFALSPTSFRLLRSTNTERCSLASQFTNGQDATSCFATNDTGATAESTVMSSQETWFEISSTPCSSTTSPSMLRRMPTILHTCR